MAVAIGYDVDDMERLKRMLLALPPEMQRQAIGRSLGRSRAKVERTYARLASKRMKVPQWVIKEVMQTTFRSPELKVVVSSQQLSLIKLKAQQAAKGVKVNMRGLYRQAFIAEMRHGRAVFIRSPMGEGRAPRGPVHEVFGPNPAGEIMRNPETYREMLGEIFDDELKRLIAQNVTGLLKKLNG